MWIYTIQRSSHDRDSTRWTTVVVYCVGINQCTCRAEFVAVSESTKQSLPNNISCSFTPTAAVQVNGETHLNLFTHTLNAVERLVAVVSRKLTSFLGSLAGVGEPEVGL